MKKRFFIITTSLVVTVSLFAQLSDWAALDEWALKQHEEQKTSFGYPVNEKSALHEFYRWYVSSGMDIVNINNAGDPMTDTPTKMSSQQFEKEVINYFAPLYGFDLNDTWGIVTHSGTDGNNHGIYFGAKYLYNKTKKMPIVYVSDEAHYSNMRLCDLQNLDLRLIKSDKMGRMIPEELEKNLDLKRPALIIYAMGSTFKGAIDNQKELNAVLDKHPKLVVYRHIDAALFGGYLPFTEFRDMVDRKNLRFESIAVSGHKFFGIDSPCGLFICTKNVYDNQNNFNITYLNANMRMINCSRDAVQPLKFWWLIKKVGPDHWSKQAQHLMDNAAYLKQKLDEIGWPCWVNEFSNTVFFKRPSADIVSKYNLAQGHDEQFGGDLAHIVVMQHVTRDKIDQFVDELRHSH